MSEQFLKKTMKKWDKVEKKSNKQEDKESRIEKEYLERKKELVVRAATRSELIGLRQPLDEDCVSCWVAKTAYPEFIVLHRKMAEQVWIFWIE